MIRVAVASVVSLLALPAAANAALPAAHPPANTVAGARLAWPLKTAETSLAPGSKLTVTVRSTRRRAIVSLVRADARGIPTRLLARRTLRSGAFTVSLPVDQGAAYQLRVVVAGKRYWSWITTPAAASADPCIPQTAPASAELQLQTTSLARGGSLAYAVHNTGSTCLTAGEGYSWERKAGDGSWQAVPLPWPFSAVGVLVRAGASYAKTARLPEDAQPGTYRLHDSVSTQAGTVDLYSPNVEVTG
jgi:hypothetical protein